MRSERIVNQLGVSHGAAANKLRKMVLFRQLEKYGDNVCVRCEKEIGSVDELSIEHIEPWEGRSADLFWDLDNIGFSHLKCNQQHVYHGGTPKRKIPPEGMSWCSFHKDFLAVENFYEDKNRWSGYNKYCINCISKLRKEYPSRKV